MLTEDKIFFDNVKTFRNLLLTEGVSESSIIRAINNHELAYLYYDGDDTIMKGYRIVVPFVLGMSTAGNVVLRAWEIEGNSDSYIGLKGRNRRDHEYHIDHDGSKKIGWRLFKVDSISSFIPMGKKYMDEEGSPKVPPLYNPHDEQMTSIVASYTTPPKQVIKTTGLDSVGEPDVVTQTVKKSEFDKQAPKFQQFYKAGKKARQITKKELMDLYHIITTVKKKSPSKYFVFVDDDGSFALKNEYYRNKFKPEQIVGNLKDLYAKIVIPTLPKDDSFFRKQNAQVKNDVGKPYLHYKAQRHLEENKPIERKTFFKI